MMLTRRNFLIVLGGLLAGCGLSGEEPDHTVVIRRDGTFEPASLTIPVGARVAWHNRGDHAQAITTDPAHNLLLQPLQNPINAPALDSGSIYPGERWMHIFSTPGQYVYSSRYAASAELLGAITVE